MDGIRYYICADRFDLSIERHEYPISRDHEAPEEISIAIALFFSFPLHYCVWIPIYSLPYYVVNSNNQVISSRYYLLNIEPSPIDASVAADVLYNLPSTRHFLASNKDSMRDTEASGTLPLEKA